MAKFRKVPVVIEAITFIELLDYGRKAGAPTYGGDKMMPWSFDYITYDHTKGFPPIRLAHHITHENDDCYLIPTLEGTMKFNRGDMLITGIKGEVYPCKMDIFHKTYEPVAELPMTTDPLVEPEGKP